jgi:hypothetical protein
MKNILKISLINFSIIISVMTKGYSQPNPEQKFDLYILMGQSNMAGRGYITDEFKEVQSDHVYLFTKAQTWVIAKHPLHFDKPAVVGVGPGLAFGLEMAKANPKGLIGLVPCAVGGSPIEHWLPGAYDSATKTHPYDDAVERIKAAMKYGTIKGIIWHQGESNSGTGQPAKYLSQLQELIQRVRDLVGNPNLPFVAGELGRYRPAYLTINDALAALPSTVPYTAVATSQDLTHRGDTIHFDGRSADILGKRYAEKMIELQKGKGRN